MSVRRACRRPSSTELPRRHARTGREEVRSSGRACGEGPVEQERAGAARALRLLSVILRPLYTPGYGTPNLRMESVWLARRMRRSAAAGEYSRRLRRSATMPRCEGTPTARTGSDGSTVLLATLRRRRVDRFIAPGSVLVDLGCGHAGSLLEAYSDTIERGIGFDVSVGPTPAGNVELHAQAVDAPLPLPDWLGRRRQLPRCDRARRSAGRTGS